MTAKPKSIVVFVTAANRREADRLARTLVQERLAACVTIVPGVFSRYWWEGRVAVGRELLLLIKTFADRYTRLEKRVRQVHSYSVPEIVALPILQGNPDYLKWMKSVLK